MSSINVTLRDSYVNKAGECRVLLTIHIDGQRVRVKSISVKPHYWDLKNRRVKTMHPESSDLNLLLQKDISRANEILVEYRLKQNDLTPEKFKKLYYNPLNLDDFLSWMSAKIEERFVQRDISEGTKAVHNTVVNHLRIFKPKIAFADFDGQYTILKDFEAYLRKEGLSVNTRSKILRSLKSYINLAMVPGVELISKSPFEVFKIEKGDGRIDYLEKEEVQKLEEAYKKNWFKAGRHIVLRNWLFMFYACGIRLSDFRKIVKQDIQGDRLMVKMVKLKRKEKVRYLPLSAQALEMIKESSKYRVKGPIFQKYSEQTERKYLKEIAEACGISTNMTFHLARHTFATLFWQETKDLATLKELLGHEKIETTMVYTHVSEKDKRDQASKFYESL
jgi:integrase